MAAPADVVAASEELAISERSSWSGALADESFKLGGYAVADVDRDWSSSSDVQLFGFTEGHTTGGFSYKLEGDGVSFTGGCTTEVRDSSANLGGGVSYNNEQQSLGCFCRGEGATTFFSVRSATTRQYAGSLTIGEVVYRIAGVYERENGPNSGDPTGYRIDSDGGPIGAVDVVKPGRVWISRAVPADQRAPIACLSAGLLLYAPPSHNMD